MPTNISSYLMPILCGMHFIGSPFFIFLSGYQRFATLYLRFSAVIFIGELLCFFTLPPNMGFEGLAYVYPPIITIVMTGFILAVKAIAAGISDSIGRRAESKNRR